MRARSRNCFLINHNREKMWQNLFSELHRCLIALKVIGCSATCDAISTETARQGTPVRRYNINRALKSVPEFAQRVERSSDLLKYKITGRGLLLLELMNLVPERIETTQF